MGGIYLKEEFGMKNMKHKAQTVGIDPSFALALA